MGSKNHSPRSSDAFLSFRGQDTRLEFLSHLHDALARGGLYVFMPEGPTASRENLSQVGRVEACNLYPPRSLERSLFNLGVKLGLVSLALELEFVHWKNENEEIVDQLEAANIKIFGQKEFNLESLGIAARAKNYSGAKLEDVVRNAVSFALSRLSSGDDPTNPMDGKSLEVTRDDFLHALREMKPTFGASTDDLERCRPHGMVDCGDANKHVYMRIMQLVELVQVSKGISVISCLLEGPRGSGKTALAATVGIASGFPCIKMVSAQAMIGLNESSKCAQILKVFEDAYKSPLSIIILDDIEWLVEDVSNVPSFSEQICHMLRALLKGVPPKEKRLLVIGTTSDVEFLNSVGIRDAFSFSYHVPTLKIDDAKKVLEKLNVSAHEDVNATAKALNDVPIKKLYILAKIASQRGNGGTSEATNSAAITQNFSSAELQGIVNGARSFALKRQISMDDLNKPFDERSIKVAVDDSDDAFKEIIPASRASSYDIVQCGPHGIVDCGDGMKHIYKRVKLLVEHIKASQGSSLVACLLEGPNESGKTALAASVALDSHLPHIKVSEEAKTGLSESAKCQLFVKAFEDAYQSPESIIILDEIESLVEYVRPDSFNSSICHTIRVLLKCHPPEGKKLLVIGTTSEVGFLDAINMTNAFSVTYHVAALKADDAKGARTTECSCS